MMLSKMNKKIVVLSMLAVVAVASGWWANREGPPAAAGQEIQPTLGRIRRVVSTTGTVEPQNRLEIRPPIAGRIEEIRVTEGQAVKAGQVLALMSSTERAALLDAARLKGGAELGYWQDVYKPTPLIAPIDGEAIVRSVEPGQTVTTADPVLVLSDHLIVTADVDETDIGEIRPGQSAVIGLDAYPRIQVPAQVDHISYESELVNNVTIYQVDILPAQIPAVFRSGMSANVEIIIEERPEAVLLPIEAVNQQPGQAVVLLKDPASGAVRSVGVTTGLQDAQNIEISSGVSPADIIVIPSKTAGAKKASSGGRNPFMPSRPKR